MSELHIRVGTRVEDCGVPEDVGRVIRVFVRDNIEWFTVHLDDGREVTRRADQWR